MHIVTFLARSRILEYYGSIIACLTTSAERDKISIWKGLILRKLRGTLIFFLLLNTCFLVSIQ